MLDFWYQYVLPILATMAILGVIGLVFALVVFVWRGILS